MSEAGVSSQLSPLAASMGNSLWRNNNGACHDGDRLIRYGLANTSAQLNKVFKSSDYIGMTPVIIRPEHVGQLFGLFTACEVKPEGWHLVPSDARGQGQLNFINEVIRLGGLGFFASDPQHYINGVSNV